MSVWGIDYSWGRPSSMGALKAAGVKFVCRYLSGGSSKDLTRHEAMQLSAAGIAITVVWETDGGRAREGHHAGVTDAKAAAKQAKDCGQPSDRPIYFAVDFDGAGSEVDAYFRGVQSVLGWRAGAYAGYGVIRYLFDHGLIGWAWQTSAWSGGAWEKRAHLQQYSNNHSVAGAKCDFDRSVYADFGQWLVGWTPAKPNPYPLLHRGVKSADVARLSRNLHFLIDSEKRNRAYYLPDWPGLFAGQPFFTSGLESALASFQFRHHLHRTGTTNRETWDALSKAIQAQKAMSQQQQHATPATPTPAPTPTPTGRASWTCRDAQERMWHFLRNRGYKVSTDNGGGLAVDGKWGRQSSLAKRECQWRLGYPPIALGSKIDQTFMNALQHPQAFLNPQRPDFCSRAAARKTQHRFFDVGSSPSTSHLQWYINQYRSHHDLADIPQLEIDGKRGDQTKVAKKMALYYLGFGSPEWRTDPAYNKPSDEQLVAWLRHPSSRNSAMQAKGKSRQAHRAGAVVVLPSANRAGVTINHQVMETCARIAAFARETVYIQCGTNHCQYVNCSPGNNVSDHWAGNAADLRVKEYGGTDGDLLCASALRVAGYSEDEAWALARGGERRDSDGGEHVHVRGGYRYDILWKTKIGGDHYEHVHVGVRPV